MKEKGLRVLITGAAGFIGSHTADLLISQNCEVLGSAENLNLFFEKGGIFEPADITKTDEILPIMRDFSPDAVIHLAAQPSLIRSEQFPRQDLRTNIEGTLSVIMAAKSFGVGRFVMASTSAVYSELNPPRTYNEDYAISPASSYGISKASAEMYVRKNFDNHAILRYGNVFGPRQVPLGENQLIARAIRHFLEGTDFEINGDGEQSRDFVYVSDVARANAIAATCAVSGTFNISIGQAVSVNASLKMLEQIYDVLGYAWSHNQNDDPRTHIKLGVGRASRYLFWTATTSLLDGLKETADWWEGRLHE